MMEWRWRFDDEAMVLVTIMRIVPGTEIVTRKAMQIEMKKASEILAEIASILEMVTSTEYR